MRRILGLGISLLGLVLALAPLSALGGSVVWNFGVTGLPVVPAESTLAGTAQDWTLIENPDNVAVTQTACEFTGESMIFTDDASLANNLGLQTAQNAALRNAYKLSGPGDQLFIICDHKWLMYGHRANLASGTVDQTRTQMFWIPFLTSSGAGIGLNYGAGNYNTDSQIFFQAIGNGALTQSQMLNDYVIEQGAEENLSRRTLTLRITELPSGDAVMIDARYDNGDYKRISNYYNLPISNYPAGNGDGDGDVLAAIGNYSGSGAIQFELYQLTLTDVDPAPDAPGANEPMAIRSTDSPTILLGSSLKVNLQIFNPSQKAQQVAIVESFPEGWSVNTISHQGTVTANQITWDLNLPAGVTNLTYTLVAPQLVQGAPMLTGTIGAASIGGVQTVGVKRAFYPKQTAWQPPVMGWDYIYDPDLGSPEDIALDGWSHDNGSDSYIFQPVIPAGPHAGTVWKNPGFIDDGMGGVALRIDDPGDTTAEPYSLSGDPRNRKITLNYDLGPVTKAVAAFRVRSVPHKDQFGTDIPFGYPDADQYNLLGLVINRAHTDLTNWAGLSNSGLFFSPAYPDSLNFPNFGEQVDQYIPGKYDENWDNQVWHEYWITYNITPGEKATALYVDGQLQAKYSFPLQPGDPDYIDSADFHDAQAQGAFFNRSREADAGIPEGNLVFRITFRNTGDAGTLDFDYIALASGTNEVPTEFVIVPDWSLY